MTEFLMGLFDMLGRGGDYVKNKSKDVANAGVNKGKEIVGYGLIKANAKFIADSFKTMTQPVKVSSAQKLSFEQYVQKNHIDQADLVKNYKSLSIAFYITMCGSIGALLMMLFAFAKPDKLMLIGQFVSSLSISGFFIASMLNFGWRAYQIRKRDFVRFNVYLKSGAEIFPRFKLSHDK